MGVVSYEDACLRHVGTSSAVFHSELCLSPRLLNFPRRGIITLPIKHYRT